MLSSEMSAIVTLLTQYTCHGNWLQLQGESKMQRNPSFKQTFECENIAFLILKWINKISSKVNKASLALPFYAFIQAHSSFTWEYIYHSGAPQFLSLEDISPDHPLLTSSSSTHPHRNEKFSVGRFTEFRVSSVGKKKIGKRTKKKSFSFNNVFDGLSVGNSRREEGSYHLGCSCKIVWFYANLLKAFKWGLQWIEIHFKAQVFWQCNITC